MGKPTVYEIIWRSINRRTGEWKTIKVCDYIQTSFPWLFRDNVVSTDKAKLEITLKNLRDISPDDYEYSIVEKIYD
jgi:hypothetical protein